MATRHARRPTLVAALYDDPEQCAKVAKLRYVSPDQPGLTRLRKGKGFTYRDASGVTVVDVKIRDRIRKHRHPAGVEQGVDRDVAGRAPARRR